jgi:hypothetical protein
MSVIFPATFLLSYGAGDIAANFPRRTTSRDAPASATDPPFGENAAVKSGSLKKKRP